MIDTEHKGVTRDVAFNTQMQTHYDVEEDVAYKNAQVVLTSGNIQSNTDFPRSNYWCVAVRNSGTSQITFKYKLEYDDGSDARSTVVNSGEVFKPADRIRSIEAGGSNPSTLTLFYIDRQVWAGSMAKA